MKNKKTTIIILLVIITLAVSSYFIKIPYSISSKGIVYPIQEWTISKSTNGTLFTVLRNNRINSISQYSVSEFVRGDASEFILNNEIFSKLTINYSDTIGYIYSNEDRLRLLELEGKLINEERLFDVYASGEKQELVDYYRELKELASVEWETQKGIFERVNRLYNDSLVSRNDFEIALNELKIKEHNFKIAESNVRNMETGAKEEQLNLSTGLIESYEQQIEQLNKKIKANIIIAPFNGKIIRQKKGNVDLNGNIIDIEEIIKMVDISSMLVVLPIEFYENKYLKLDGIVNFGETPQGKIIQGKIIDIDNSVQILKRRQVIFITVEITENIDQMFFNMFLDGSIECGEISLFEYFLRLFNTVSEN
ncbi:MAG: hypothetical protein PHT69_12200 [Bacteroidales bacterium]|nr:hypothetical protein [Bacteroidales bacterium]